ncbi:hypothetical protein ALC56_10447 [Trachymyrmex septentrionalis]|uniref:Uncharacterized protein n=1 Tax=Trachymyrmex septentrionalis TaxID=34720 RepID=A0A195F524_9HYME|nr:hypothetical protein ALC56_10447 [Trachymyrmex septentrionalis]
MVLTPMTQQRTVKESPECFLRVAATVCGHGLGYRRSGRQCLNAFRYEKERRRFHPKREFLRARKRRRAGWRKPVSPGGRFGVLGREDFLGKGEREDSRKTSYERQRQRDGKQG